jgi:hypothetical protein
MGKELDAAGDANEALDEFEEGTLIDDVEEEALEDEKDEEALGEGEKELGEVE